MRARVATVLAIVTLFTFLPVTRVATTGFFDNAEYAARRAKVMERIGNGVAIVAGAQPLASYVEYRQSNDFMYLTGVEMPNAYLVIDGEARQSTLFFTATEASARNDGIPAELVRNPQAFTGIEQVGKVADLSIALERLATPGRAFYTMLGPEELARECSMDKGAVLQRTMVNNPWDGRPTREAQFVQRLKTKYPGVEVKNLSPIVTELRVIKSPAEIAALRRAGKLAVQATIETMKATRVGVKEYELAALYEYLVKKGGAQDLAYYMVLSSGPNHPYVHYYKHDRTLADGDFIVMDVGPSLDYYDIDITVSYPANGKFTARQKEVYEAVNAVHEASMKVYRPGLTLDQCRKEVADLLTKQGFDLSKDYFKRARGDFGHYVGMAVHDVGMMPLTLRPGMVFANEPMVIYPNESLGVRVEDTILITDTGAENLTAGLPRTVKEIEAVMKKRGT
ncbi:MAG: aminopeptidase P N-terminal domain-containing protein [Bacteroidales bacterium]